VGDEISKSARIGTTGSSGVYFEVRRGRHSQDARSWLGL
jgi:septal ring factor EnvC (AmiA/AmiB activator)